MNTTDLEYAADLVRAVQWRSRATRRLMDAMLGDLTPEEEAGAEQARVPLTYGALCYLDEQAGELLAELVGPDPDFERALDELHDCRRAIVWCDDVSDQQLAAAERAGIREAILDRMVLVTAATETLRTECREMERVLRAVLLNDPAPVEDPDPYTPGLPPEDVFEPGDGAAPPAGANALVWALDELRDSLGPREFTADDELHVQLPAGAFKGAAIGLRSWAPVPRYEPWWGEAKMHVWGRGIGATTIVPCHSEQGWGSSLQVEPNDDWSGRIAFHAMTIQASGHSAVSGGAYGTQEKRPIHPEFHDVRIEDHPDPEVWTKWGGSWNQCSLLYMGCEFELWRSKEHVCYRHNGTGPLGMYHCRVIACGGQVVQDVNRISEGPNYGDALVEVEDCDLRDFHRHPSRAGSAITVAGTGLLMRRTLVADVNRQEATPLDGLTSHGAVVVWDGGHATWDRTPTGRKNDEALLVDCYFVMHNGDRDVLSFDSVDAARMVGCGVYSTNGKGVSASRHGDGSVDTFIVKGCNTSDIRDRVMTQYGLPAAELKDAGGVTWGPDRQVVGAITETSIVGK